jgi:tRNA-dihydrouridine synthase
MFSVQDIVKFIKFTGANGVLVARGAIHNPMIFEQKLEIESKVFDPEWKEDELETVW